MDPTPPASGCLRCGVCCHSTMESYVRVTGDDWARLGDAVEKFAHFIGHRAYLRMHQGRCAALEIRLTGDPATVDYFCTIYARRPQICRDLGRGSPECLGELSRKEMPRFPTSGQTASPGATQLNPDR